jgi:hypothetical protein
VAVCGVVKGQDDWGGFDNEWFAVGWLKVGCGWVWRKMSCKQARGELVTRAQWWWVRMKLGEESVPWGWERRLLGARGRVRAEV